VVCGKLPVSGHGIAAFKKSINAMEVVSLIVIIAGMVGLRLSGSRQ